jgi:hypothetical protein
VKGKKGKGYEIRMEGLLPLSCMVAGGSGFDEEGNVLPSTSLTITGMEMLPCCCSDLPVWNIVY